MKLQTNVIRVAAVSLLLTSVYIGSAQAASVLRPCPLPGGGGIQPAYACIYHGPGPITVPPPVVVNPPVLRPCPTPGGGGIQPAYACVHK
jgi:hypothetical protein